MRTVIGGTPTLTDYSVLLRAVESSSFPITSLLCGIRGGVDALVSRLAYERKIPLKRFPPEWNSIGKAARFVANFEICAFADQVIVITDGRDKESESLKEYARRTSCKLYVENLTPVVQTLTDLGRLNSQHAGNSPISTPVI